MLAVISVDASAVPSNNLRREQAPGAVKCEAMGRLTRVRSASAKADRMRSRCLNCPPSPRTSAHT